MSNPNAAPVEAPKEIIPEAPLRPVDGGCAGRRRRRRSGRHRRRRRRRTARGAAAAAAAPAAPVRVGGNIKTPTKTKDVKPVYPPIAQSARVSGVVIIEATIGADGRVKDAKVLRSIPLLDQAALDAVKQWQFTPTLLNGVPVPVIMTVTVNFTLQ